METDGHVTSTVLTAEERRLNKSDEKGVNDSLFSTLPLFHSV